MYDAMYVPAPSSEPRRSAPWLRALAKVIGWFMSFRWMVTAQFWLAIWSGLWVLAQDGRLKWRWKASAMLFCRIN